MRHRRLLLTTAVILTMGLVSVPTLARADPESAQQAEEEMKAAENSFVSSGEVELAPDGESWIVVFRAGGQYIASWERKDGYWEDPDAAFAAVEAASTCRTTLLIQYAKEFDSYDDLLSSDDIVESEGGGWRWADGSDQQQALAKCRTDSDWAWADTPSEDREDGTTAVRVPLTKIGPGTHEIFLLTLNDNSCETHEWPDGSWITLGCSERGQVVTATVDVPQPPQASPTAAPEATDDPSAMPSDGDGADTGGVQPAWIVGGGIAVLALAGLGYAVARSRRR